MRSPFVMLAPPGLQSQVLLAGLVDAGGGVIAEYALKIERFGLCVIGHGNVQSPQIVEDLAGVWVIGAERFLSNLERVLKKGFSLGVITQEIIQ